MNRTTKLMYFVAGAAFARYAPKLIHTSGTYKKTKYAIEVLKAHIRLEKVLRDEYYRIDEAIELERSFLKMIAPSPNYHIDFSVVDKDGQRRIDYDFGIARKKDD